MHSLSFAATLAAVPPWVANWLTPVWLLGIGAVAGLLILAVLWLLVAALSRLPGVPSLTQDAEWARGSWSGRILAPILSLISPRTVAEVPLAVREGPLWPILIITLSLAAFGIVGAALVQEPGAALRSLARLAVVGEQTSVREVPVSEPENPQDPLSDRVAHVVPLSVIAAEAMEIRFRSDQNLEIATRPFVDVKSGAAIEVLANEPAIWIKGQQTASPFLQTDVTELHVRNKGTEPARLSVTVVSAPPIPEVRTVPVTALSVVAVFVFYIVTRTVAPRLSAIALAAYKNEVSQPLFAIFMVVGLVALFAFIWIPFYTFGEDIKVLKDSGLTTVLVLGIVQAVWAASNSVSEEIEGKTALTVLSKPIGRRSFIIGKFLGIMWSVAILFVVLGALLLLVTAYKPIYDARESVTSDATWQVCHMEMTYVVPGLVLAFIETAMLAAISVAISTRLPMLANFVICFAIYALGHLTPLIVDSSIGQFVVVQFLGQLIAVVFPTLDHFSLQAAIAGGQSVPLAYLGATFLYGMIYCFIALLLALFLFEDRDLA
jgi:ABC-type transport system involved in multi-copper enzyme maturation permease subunit